MAGIAIRINRDECILCGSCWEDCPQVFEESPEDGLSRVVTQFQVDSDPARGRVPDRLADCVQAAADNCPVEIIELDED